MRDHPDRIPIDQCQLGWLYRVYSRNLNLGEYRESDRGFVGIRQKLGHRFLFTEFHWDIGAPYGTANPLERLCECPVAKLDEYLSLSTEELIANEELFNWIETQGERLGIVPESC